MSGANGVRDKLQALRARVTAATTPAERVNSKLELAEELWHRDPVAARPLFEEVVAEAEAAGLAPRAGRAASILCEMLRHAGDLEGSARYAELLLRDADRSGKRDDRACALNLVGLIHQERGELDQALACFEEFLRLSREIGFKRGEQPALNQLAGVHALQGELDKALGYYQQALRLTEESSDFYARALQFHNVGWTLEAMGRWAEATEHFHRAVALCEEHDNRDLLLACRMALGELALKRSDYDNAALVFRHVIDAAREMNHSGGVYREALSNLGWTYFRNGDLARAEETLAEAARLSHASEDRYQIATFGCRRAELALAQGRLDSARDLLVEAARQASALKLRKEQGEVLRVEALLSAARSDAGPALDLFARAEAAQEPLGDTYELAQARLQHGRLLFELERTAEALPLLQNAARTFRRLAVVAEAEEAGRLLYRIEVRSDRDAALLQGLFGIAALGLVPELFMERALFLLCDNLRFEHGAVLLDGRPVALRGRPDQTQIPDPRTPLTQSDLALFLPVKKDRRLLGSLWLGRGQPLSERVDRGLLELVSRALAPEFQKLLELKKVEAGGAPEVPGLRFRGVVGSNPEVLDLLNLVPRVAATPVPVLIRGESGSGKELIARALHDSGPRAERPFVTVNCAAVPENLLEAEFFGVEEGAATGVAARPGKFELADTGTIFLDEIADMSPALQARLLRAIEDKTITRVGGSGEKQVDVRVIAATHADLDLRERQGLFRRDLLYRLNTVQFLLPPLRRRREDLPALTGYFIARTAQEYCRPVLRASEAVLALFATFSWPGNIRQLQHVIERAVILASGHRLEIADLPPELRQAQLVTAAPPAPATRDDQRKVADEAERTWLLKAIERSPDNMTEAARLSGYSRAQFYRLLRKHHLGE
ncbi:tetratricopeptide repeat protein [candidate division WOR-3 bacterium]|uniref:Tetratricopeptide repeat protein n=1 Tax=candidate division WOR-3 bacterium TaxID=2052148 RepID=A0A937XGI6_UNCW3|nr:tetratricopeptide repeat protein [candidate division WOR-3 bacterium]